MREIDEISTNVHMFWVMIEPLLFGLIGSMVDISLVDPNLIAKAVGVLVIALVCRGLGA